MGKLRGRLGPQKISIIYIYVTSVVVCVVVCGCPLAVYV